MPDTHHKDSTFEAHDENATIELLLERASCRNFLDKEISPEILDTILEAGFRAPSGGNLQPYSIIKFENEETRHSLSQLCDQQFMASAPVHLLFCIDWRRTERWAELECAPFSVFHSFRHFWVAFQDTIICCQNICTAADALGLGSVYIGTVLEFFPKLITMCQLPHGVFPVVLLCLGYPKQRPKPRKKLGAKILLHNEKYQELADLELLEAMNTKYSKPQIDINQQNIQKLTEVCQEVGGDKLVQKVLNRVNEQGFISKAQHYFGLHYCANYMMKNNREYLDTLYTSGFSWIKPETKSISLR